MADVRHIEGARKVGGRRYASVVAREEMPAVACAFCESEETEPASIYGCHMMTAQYYCRSCRSVFDWVREEPLGAEPDDS